MIYKKIITIPAKEEVIELYVAPCIKCEIDDIRIDDYEDQYGHISTALCKKCGQKVKDNVGAEGIIKIWNNKNDIEILLKTKIKQVAILRQEIKELKIKYNKKKKVK